MVTYGSHALASIPGTALCPPARELGSPDVCWVGALASADGGVKRRPRPVLRLKVCKAELPDCDRHPSGRE